MEYSAFEDFGDNNAINFYELQMNTDKFYYSSVQVYKCAEELNDDKPPDDLGERYEQSRAD